MKRSPILLLIIIGVGTALFVLLGSVLTVPSPVPGVSLPFPYALLSFLAILYGPVTGLAVGVLGRLLTDLIRGAGLWWSWIVASGAFGLLMALAGRRFRFCRRPFGLNDAAAFILCAVACHLICWAVLTPILDAVLYGAPYGQMLLQGLVNAALNAFVTAVAGTLLCFFCSAFRRRKARQKRSRPVAAGKPE
ncbi:MAG: ECF-type riboflavin transporter substrate-binding protein [Oscillospiraceae bacterium]|nr:ECF-type riboflavin transporter substrate-binding protein [Oscillospiraceae bacterium]